MQVIEKSADGLSRTFGVRVGAEELGARLEERIAEIAPTLRLKGFRPGKVPQTHVRRVFGKALMGEVVEKTLSETTQKVLDERQLRLAAQPDLAPQSDMAKVIAGEADLDYDLSIEVMPDFEPVDVSQIALEKPVYTPDEAEIAAALEELARQSRTFAARSGKTAKAEAGDQVALDFAGSVDGAPFEGGTAQDVEVVLGSGRLLPGFEDQLVGAKAGETRTVE
ncbi:MAG: trigger factor, partial [Candidatus Dormibacteria bacterium]